MEEVESKKYAWKWVTADMLLTHAPCELLYALHIPSGAGTSTSIIYNGENTSGEIVVSFRIAESRHQTFDPKMPVYCSRGLYVDVGTITRGIFVQWRELGFKEGR